MADDVRHTVARRMPRNGYGRLLSFDFVEEWLARRVADGVRVVQIAETLGGVMTTVVLPKASCYCS